MNDLYITGAGVSAESGIPTFRGQDGFWTIGSKHYTPEQMATRFMYQHNPTQFLAWYYHRFASYRDHGPNDVHRWLADKNLITQNIDGLDAKAGNKNYIGIHGRLDLMTLYHEQSRHEQVEQVSLLATPWGKIDNTVEKSRLEESLLKLFAIKNHRPELSVSYKPFVLLFDEYYSELYRMSEAKERMQAADRIIFMGTSFSVNITQIALDIAFADNKPIEIVDPSPVKIHYPQVTYHKMKALDFIQNH